MACHEGPGGKPRGLVLFGEPKSGRGVITNLATRLQSPSSSAADTEQGEIHAESRNIALAALALTPLAAFADDHAAKAAAADPVLAEVVAGDWRSDEAKARDRYRHPVESLTFYWGLQPGMTILEVQPGGASWWTEILAPYAKRTRRCLLCDGSRCRQSGALRGCPQGAFVHFEARYGAKPDLYGKVGVVNWGPKSKPLPKSSYDFILTARSIHGWMGTPGMLEKTFREFHDALKPGGILAVEQHRANPGPQDPKAASGYVTEGRT